MRSKTDSSKLARWALVALTLVLAAACTSDPDTADTTSSADAATSTTEATGTTDDPDATPATDPDDGASGGREDALIVKAFRAPDAEIANPYVASSDAVVSDGVHQLVFEPLFYTNYSGEGLEPWLATGYEYNEDNTMVTISLRDGVTWADGEPFSADDVVFTLDQILAAEAPYRAANIQASVASAAATDDLTVEITLTSPNPRFVETDLSYYIYTSNFIPLPQHVFEGEDFETFAFFDPAQGWPIGTGPYTLEEIGPDRSVLARHDGWWAADTGFASLPAPEQVVFSLAGPEDSIIAELVSGDLDWAGHYGLTAAGAETAIAQNDNLQSIEWNDPCPWGLTVNTAAAPWDDPEMRWALSYAINKSQFSALFNQPADPSPARSTFPEYPGLTALLDANSDLFEQYNTLAHDPDMTASILEGKGYQLDNGVWVGDDGAPLTVRLSIFNAAALGAVWTNAEQLLIQNLQDAGFTVESAPGDFGAIVDARTNGDFDIQSWFECGSVTDPWSTLDRYAGETGSDNPGGWNNDDYNDLVAQIGELAPGDAQIEELTRDALEIFLAELPVIPLAQRPEPLVTNTEFWTGWPTDGDPYAIPASWAMTFHQVVTQLQPAE